MKNLITRQNLTFTNKKCNCGLKSNTNVTNNTNKIKLSNKSKSKKNKTHTKHKKSKLYTIFNYKKGSCLKEH